MTRTVNIGLIGAGTVGGGVAQALKRNGALMASRLGARVRVSRVAVRNLRKKRLFGVRKGELTTDWKSVVNDPKIDLVVELIGGTATAKSVVLAGLRASKPVVTANKALLAFHGEQLFAAAERHNANLYYEASVAGGEVVDREVQRARAGLAERALAAGEALHEQPEQRAPVQRRVLEDRVLRGLGLEQHRLQRRGARRV